MTVWWIWFAAAALCGALELLLPVFAFLGFAGGAAITGLVLFIGVDLGGGTALLIFALSSAALFGVLRLALGHDAGTERIVQGDVNDNPPPRDVRGDRHHDLR